MFGLNHNISNFLYIEMWIIEAWRPKSKLHKSFIYTNSNSTHLKCEISSLYLVEVTVT